MFKNFNIVSFIIILFFFASSCNNGRVFDKVEKMPVSGWKSEETIDFTVPVNDTTKAYDIFLHIRNDADYEYSNLWLFITTHSPGGESVCDTLEFVLAKPSGEWLGSGLGAVNSMLIQFKDNIRFPHRGLYTFKIQQAMRKNTLSGVKNIGIQVQEHN